MPCAAAFCLAAAPVALAEGPDKPDDQDVPQGPLQEIVVSGYRQSIDASLDAKREADATVDIITAQDVGKFPDKNVADALQRVPGVIISRDGGEGDKVSIRGLSSDLTLTELNGNYIASIDGSDSYEPSRSFNYTLLPSNMISRVEVFKTAEAHIDEGGVGGTVILHTRRPLGHLRRTDRWLLAESNALHDGNAAAFRYLHPGKNGIRHLRPRARIPR